VNSLFLFVGDHYYADGGIFDFLCRVTSTDDALEKLNAMSQQPSDGWAHCATFDGERFTLVAQFANNAGAGQPKVDGWFETEIEDTGSWWKHYPV